MPRATSHNFKQELKKNENFREIDFLLQDSISQIETSLMDYDQNGYITINRKLGDFPRAPPSDMPIYVYIQKDFFQNVYERTKVELTRMLIKINE